MFDALAKGLHAARIQKHLEVVNTEIKSDRHRLAPTLDCKEGRAENRFEDE